MSNAVEVTPGVGSRTVTSSLHGLIPDDARSRGEFLDLTGIRS